MVYIGRIYASWDDYNDSNIVDCCSFSKINLEKDKRTYKITDIKNTITDIKINTERNNKSYFHYCEKKKLNLENNKVNSGNYGYLYRRNKNNYEKYKYKNKRKY